MRIWILWLQGWDVAPEIIKRCSKSLEKFKPANAEIIYLDGNNLDNYIEGEDYEIFKRMFLNENITMVCYSDYIRVKILMGYGGLWCDSTMYFTNYIPDDILNLDIFGFKSPKWFYVGMPIKCDLKSIDSYFVIANKDKSEVYNYLSKMVESFFQFIKKKDVYMEKGIKISYNYYIFWQFTEELYYSDKEIKLLIDKIPYFSNQTVHALQYSFYNLLDKYGLEEAMKILIENNTIDICLNNYFANKLVHRDYLHHCLTYYEDRIVPTILM